MSEDADSQTKLMNTKNIRPNLYRTIAVQTLGDVSDIVENVTLSYPNLSIRHHQTTQTVSCICSKCKTEFSDMSGFERSNNPRAIKLCQNCIELSDVVTNKNANEKPSKNKGRKKKRKICINGATDIKQNVQYKGTILTMHKTDEQRKITFNLSNRNSYPCHIPGFTQEILCLFDSGADRSLCCSNTLRKMGILGIYIPTKLQTPQQFHSISGHVMTSQYKVTLPMTFIKTDDQTKVELDFFIIDHVTSAPLVIGKDSLAEIDASLDFAKLPKPPKKIRRYLPICAAWKTRILPGQTVYLKCKSAKAKLQNNTTGELKIKPQYRNYMPNGLFSVDKNLLWIPVTNPFHDKNLHFRHGQTIAWMSLPSTQTFYVPVEEIWCKNDDLLNSKPMKPEQCLSVPLPDNKTDCVFHYEYIASPRNANVISLFNDKVPVQEFIHARSLLHDKSWNQNKKEEHNIQNISSIKSGIQQCKTSVDIQQYRCDINEPGSVEKRVTSVTMSSNSLDKIKSENKTDYFQTTVPLYSLQQNICLQQINCPVHNCMANQQDHDKQLLVENAQDRLFVKSMNEYLYPYLSPEDDRLPLTRTEVVDKYLKIDSSDISENDKHIFKQMFLAHHTCQSVMDEVEAADFFCVTCDFHDDKPFYIKPYVLNKQQQNAIQKEADRMEYLGITASARTSYSSPCLAIEKKDKDLKGAKQYRIVGEGFRGQSLVSGMGRLKNPPPNVRRLRYYSRSTGGKGRKGHAMTLINCMVPGSI